MFQIDFNGFIFSEIEYNEMDSSKLKKHIHPSYELLYVTNGEIEYVIEDNGYTLKKGDLLLIKPAKYHFVRNINKPPYRRFCLQFMSDFLNDDDLLQKVFEQGETFTLPENSNFEKTLILTKELTQQAPENELKTICGNLLYIILFSLLKTNVVYQKSNQILSKNCQKIYEYVDMNISNIRSLEDISQALFFSKSYINHVFKQNFNIGVMQYIRNKRVLIANQMLNEGKKPTEIYTQCGFSSYIAFFRAYKQYFKVSPAYTKNKVHPTPPPTKKAVKLK